MTASIQLINAENEEEILVLSDEDAKSISSLLKKGPWESGSCRCYGDAITTIGTEHFRYHKDGDITTSTHTRILSEKEKETFFAILSKYVKL